jgi:hypothetical protein
MSASEPNGYNRSERPLISPSVCGPRSINTVRIEISDGVSTSASSSRCRYFAVRDPGPLASRTQPRRERRSIAPRISVSSYSTTGSRFVAWLQASRSAFSESG